ncbi:MAG: hypothetical protein E6Q27_02510 [Aeromicrobium sp.]|nr:MAG: hypothetical protein E6Q27_02510 [Aeromicrobium sp.]
MTNSPHEPAGHLATPPIPGEADRSPNPVGILGLVASLLGFALVCIPGTLTAGLMLLPIAFVLAFVSLFKTGKSVKAGVAALIASIFGTAIGFVILLFIAADAIKESNSDSDVTALTPDRQPPDKSAKKYTARGSHKSPIPVGSSLKDNEWEITLHSVNLNANEAVAMANDFNDPPAAGNVFILANMTATYVGDDPDGSYPWIDVNFLTQKGATFSSTEGFVVGPDEFNSFDILHKGESQTGNFLIEVPIAEADSGLLAALPWIRGDLTFFTVK